ncbi:MAG: histidine kinase, partial [Acetivibrio sp.]
LQRETDYTKYLAYNLTFRETLESHPYDNVQIAQSLNKTVEPIFWYFITSDVNIKRIKIVTPYVERAVGSFLEPAKDYEKEDWYQRNRNNFNTLWTVEEDRLYATRTILDTATTSKPIGIMRMEFYLNRLIEPITSMNYLDNGIIVKDGEGNVIYEKGGKDEKVNDRVAEQIKQMKPGEEKVTSRYILKSGSFQNTDWRIYYYIDKKMISHQVSSIVTSTLWVVLSCIFVIFIFINILSKTLSKRILVLKEHAEEVAGGNLEHPCYTGDTDEIGVVTNSLGKMTEQLNDMINQVYKIEIEKKATELKALQAMINPHFLYNCLSSIKWKALQKGDEEISEITGLIAKFYRIALNNGKQTTTVESELENIKAYVEIQM